MMIEKPSPPLHASSNRASRSEELRGDIDSGRTGDKVPFRDPAAAPLGADDEAAGHTPSPEEVARARTQETRPGGVVHPNATEQDRKGFVVRPGRPWPYIAIGLAAIAIAGMALAVLFGG